MVVDGGLYMQRQPPFRQFHNGARATTEHLHVGELRQHPSYAIGQCETEYGAWTRCEPIQIKHEWQAGKRISAALRFTNSGAQLCPLVTKPVLPGLVANIEALEQFSTRPQEFRSGLRLRFDVDGEGLERDILSICPKMVAVPSEGSAKLHQSLAQTTACLLRTTIRPKMAFDPTSPPPPVRCERQERHERPRFRSTRSEVVTPAVTHLESADEANLDRLHASLHY
jgi:hypothetical protein